MAATEAWDRFWFAPAPLTRLAAFRILIMALVVMNLVAYSTPAFADAAKVTAGVGMRPWTPIYLFEILHLEPIDTFTAELVFWTGVVAAVLAIVGLATRVACAVAAVVHVYWVGLVYSFGKAHHDQIALTFAVLALPLAPVGARLSLDALIARYRRTRRGGDPAVMPELGAFALVPIRLTQVTAALGYGFAGATKLVVSGVDWANGYTLMGHLMGHDNAWSRFYTERLLLSQVLATGTLALQTLFPLVFLFPVLRWVFLPGAVAFHLSTWKTMDTGPYMTLWFTLIAFLPLERIPAWIGRRPDGTRAPAAATVLRLLLAAIPTAVVLYVFSRYFPAGMAVVLVPPVAALAIYLWPGAALTVVYDGSCGMCKRAFAVMKALDWTNSLTGVDLRDWPSVQARFPGLDEAACIREMHVVAAGGEARAGFAAYQRIAWRLPLFAVLSWLLYLPPVPQLGRLVYRRIADRRVAKGCGDGGCPVHPGP